MPSRKVLGWLLRAVVLACCWAWPAAGQTQPSQKALGFSNLMFRVDRGDEIGIAREDFKVHILEDLRRRGLNAVGAENLVFGDDRSQSAELVLGGTITELDCRPGSAAGQVTCRMGVEWQVLDVPSNTVVYKVTTRGVIVDVAKDPPMRVGRQLIQSTLNSLTTRPQFRRLLRPDPTVASMGGYVQATFGACRVPARSMPAASEQVLDATVLVQTSSGFGSGFIASSDGFVLTAAHVVSGSAVTVKLRDGREFAATTIRADRRLDIALLRMGLPPGVTLPCMPVALDPVSVGADAYAIGSPARRELSFSLARGIVSGIRLLEGVQYLQTDAAVNRGNSGGPLVDAAGEAVAIVSSKLVGLTVEGIAFGVPLRAGLNALNLAPADGFTSPLLASADPVSVTPVRQTFVDEPDAVPDLSTAPAKDEPAKNRRRLSPGKTALLSIGGGLLAAGLMFVLIDDNRRDLGWVMAGAGAGGLLVSIAID